MRTTRMINCDWCKEKLPHIFAGDEIELLGHYFFVCMSCRKAIKDLKKRRKQGAAIKLTKIQELQEAKKKNAEFTEKMENMFKNRDASYLFKKIGKEE